jgi:hypothetical protein
MKSLKNLSIYVLSGALIFVGIASASQAQAAWTSKESSRVKALEKRVQQLEGLVNETSDSQELITVRYLAVGSRSGLMGDVCPGPSFEDPQYPNVGKISSGTDLTGSPTSKTVYVCKIQFYAKKSN